MSPVRPRSPAPKSVLSAVHFSHNSAGQKQTSPAEARYPSGKGEVCKTFMRRFDPDPRLQIPSKIEKQPIKKCFQGLGASQYTPRKRCSSAFQIFASLQSHFVAIFFPIRSM